MLLYAIAIISILQVALGLALLQFYPLENPPIFSPTPTIVIQTIAFGACGAYLLFFSHERRAAFLGCAFLTIASTFAFITATKSPYTEWLLRLPVDAFLPYLIWAFACEFPRATRRTSFDAVAQVGKRVTLAGGFLLLITQWLPFDHGTYQTFERLEPQSLWGFFVYISAGLGVGVLLARATGAPENEMRRVRFFSIGIAIPGVIICIILPLLSWSPVTFAAITSDAGRIFAIPVLHSSLAALPLITSYAVLADQDVGVSVRLSSLARYQAARWISYSLIVLPALVVAIALWVNRGETLLHLFASAWGAVTFLFGAVALFVLAFRSRIETSIDGAFFREPYDAAFSAISINQTLSRASDLQELAQSLGKAVDDTLHVFCTYLLARTENEWEDPLGKLTPLPLNSPLLWHLEDDPLDKASLMSKVTAEDRLWLSELDIEVLVPIAGSSGQLIGVMLVGERISGLPLVDQDRTYLVTLAHLGAPHIQRCQEGTSDHTTGLESLSSACSNCGQIEIGDADHCSRCGGERFTLGLPQKIFQRYVSQRLLGSGAVGLAILAEDQELDRAVVLKTLPQARSALVESLQREARVMASLDHPNLTKIFDLENWRGMPIIVMEYLSGGTLQAHLGERTLSVRETLNLGVQLFEALGYLHGRGLLHRDVKPSNIGIDAFGNAKLLDFGFANSLGQDDPARSYLAGTPKYLPPETFRGEEPGASRDLWALALVLYEAHTGVHPFDGDNLTHTLRGIVGNDVQPLWDKELENFFVAALHKDPSQRYGTAPLYLAALRELQT